MVSLPKSEKHFSSPITAKGASIVAETLTMRITTRITVITSVKASKVKDWFSYLQSHFSGIFLSSDSFTAKSECPCETACSVISDVQVISCKFTIEKITCFLTLIDPIKLFQVIKNDKFLTSLFCFIFH